MGAPGGAKEQRATIDTCAGWLASRRTAENPWQEGGTSITRRRCISGSIVLSC